VKPVAVYRVRGDRVVHPDGSSSAVMVSSAIDLSSLDTARRAAASAAFLRMCHSLESPLQIVVRVRRVEDEPAGEDSLRAAHPGLDAAMRRHWATRLRARAVFTRTILLATRAPTATALDEAAEHVHGWLRAMGISAHRLEGAALHKALTAGLPLAHGTALTEHPHHVRAGACVLRSLALRRFPGHAVRPGWLAPLVTVPVACDIALHLSPAALDAALNTLTRRLRDFSAHRLLEAERGAIGDAQVDIGLDSALALRARLAGSLGRPLHCSLTVAVRAATLGALRRDSDTAARAFSSALAAAEPAHFRQLDAMVTTLPLCVDALSATKLVESGAAATCVPWLHATCQDRDGYRIGAAVHSGLPVRIAPFDTAWHANANIAVFATSGHGKSFALGCLVLEAATRGIDAVIIDPEGEYRRVVSALGGTYLALEPGGSASINVFDVPGQTDSAADEAVAGVVSLVSVLCGDRLDDLERAITDAAAREALRDAGAQGRVAVLGDCIPYLERHAVRVATIVRRYCAGALGVLFNRPTTLRIGGGVCAISMRGMPDEHVAAATLVVGRWLWQLVRRDRRRRHIVFDEVGALCSHPAMRALLVQLARRCRKYSASLVVATQNAQDLLASGEGTVIATNCATVLLGGHRPAETALMERAFGLTEAQRRLLETATRGEFLLIAGDRRLPIRVDVPAEYRAILSAAEPPPTP